MFIAKSINHSYTAQTFAALCCSVNHIKIFASLFPKPLLPQNRVSVNDLTASSVLGSQISYYNESDPVTPLDNSRSDSLGSSYNMSLLFRLLVGSTFPPCSRSGLGSGTSSALIMNTARFFCSMLNLVLLRILVRQPFRCLGQLEHFHCGAEGTSEPLLSDRSSSLNKGSVHPATMYASCRLADLLK